MKLLDEVFHDVRKAQIDAVDNDPQFRTDPIIAIYVTPGFYDQMCGEMVRWGHAPHYEFEFITSRTFLGFPVYRVVDANPEYQHPPYSVLHVGWRKEQ